MKILMITLEFPPTQRGGAEMQCLKQARALIQRGHEVTIVTRWLSLRVPRHEVMDGLNIFRAGWLLPWTVHMRVLHDGLVSMKPGGVKRLYRNGAQQPPPGPDGYQRFRWMSLAERPGAWSFLSEVTAGVRSGRFPADLIQVHESNWVAGFAQWLGEQLRIPVFCKEGLLPVLGYGAAADIPRQAEWRQRRMQCRFIAMTPAIAAALVEEGIPSERICEISNGVELPEVPADPARNSDALYVGNFTQGAAHKGFDVLLTAWGLAVSQEPGMKLRICGAGESGGWKIFAQERGCGNSVVFAGRVDDIGILHRQSGYLVLPSRKEGISNALLEAQAAGLPAVVSDIPGNRVVVHDGKTGLVVPVEDATALADAMVRLHRSPELRAQMGQAARTWAERDFSIDKIAARLEKYYLRALADGGASGHP